MARASHYASHIEKQEGEAEEIDIKDVALNLLHSALDESGLSAFRSVIRERSSSKSPL